MSRSASLDRQTTESKVHVEVDLDGSGRHDVTTGVGFYDHMLSAFARHALVDLVVHTSGDTHIDAHHTVEDTAIVLGQAIRAALGDKSGIRRFGDATVPLREIVRLFAGTVPNVEWQPILKADEVPRCRLADAPRLGWTTWLNTGDFEQDAADAVFRLAS